MKGRINLKRISKNLRKSQTPWEAKLWYYLRSNRFMGLKFKRQVPMGKFVADFCCQEKSLIIELDGSQHNAEKESKKDSQRETFLKDSGYTVLRFWNNEIDDNIEGVLEVIRTTVTSTSP